MHKPLVISKFYLLEKSTTGQIQRFFWEYLVKEGFQPTILCSKTEQSNRTKGTLHCPIIETSESRIINQVFRIVKHTIYSDIDKNPDTPYYSWAKLSALKIAKREALSGNYNYLHSTGFPIACHLIALEAKKVSGLPWIASFYDPWYKNPLRPIKREAISEKDRKLEATVAENANAIIHTNQAIYDEWVERYGDGIKEKMYVLPLVFDLPQRGERQSASDYDTKRFSISHIGNLYLDRTSVDFLMAVRKMLDLHPEMQNKLIINYVGTVTPTDKAFIEENELSSMVNIAGYLSEIECGKYYENTDLFIAVDAKTARNIFFPSKILKYFYYGKPILGLTPAHSALQYELEQSHNYVFRNDDTGQIADFLYNSIKDKNYLSGNDIDYWKNFTMEKVYPEYLKIAEKVLL